MLLSLRSTGRERVTPDFLRRRLAVREAGGARGPSRGGAVDALTSAAVLIALVAHAGGMTAIFTRRTEHLADHAGQVSFPGGRVERGDAGPVATALREAEEEIGLGPERVEVIGCLDRCDTSTGFLVTPVVGLVTPPLALTLDPFEVAEAFEVPLSFLLDPANRRREAVMYKGRKREYFTLDYEGRTIWGATARMVISLHEALYGQ
ncbi:MAG: CoA pyrophosphatase [Alphaproteobacteria bacterium]